VRNGGEVVAAGGVGVAGDQLGGGGGWDGVPTSEVETLGQRSYHMLNVRSSSTIDALKELRRA
jgi:hypothetical protein